MADVESGRGRVRLGSWAVRIGIVSACLVLAPWIVHSLFIAGLGCDELCTNAMGGPREGWHYQTGGWPWTALALLPIATLASTRVLIRALRWMRLGRAMLAIGAMVVTAGLWLLLYETAVGIWS